MPEGNLHLISHFDGDYAFLSNFYEYPFVFSGLGTEVPTAEHGFQAMKAVNTEGVKSVLDCATPGQAKRMGRKITIRGDWEEVKDDIMLDVLRDKFTADIHMMAKLLNTQDALLVEGNQWHDMYWGTCHCRDHRTQKGVNRLGELLMKVRGELRNAQETNNKEEEDLMQDPDKKATVTNIFLDRSRKGFYVGRKKQGNMWGNDWSHLDPHAEHLAVHPGCVNAEESVFAFTDWLVNGVDTRAVTLRRRIAKGDLAGQLLLCYCTPVKVKGEMESRPCHANTLGAISNQIHVDGIAPEDVFENWRNKVEAKRGLYPNYKRCSNCPQHSWPEAVDQLVEDSGFTIPEVVVAAETDSDMFRRAWEVWTTKIVREALIEPQPQNPSFLRDWADRAKEVVVKCYKCKGTGLFMVKPGSPAQCYPCDGTGHINWQRWKNNEVYWSKQHINE